MKTFLETHTHAASGDRLTGGGEMGTMMRSHDWANTPLGSIEDWPQSLKTAVNLMLNSRYPMFLGWGRDLIFCYNDAYIPVLGARHPAALGQPAAQIWAEIWDVLGPQTEVVLREGRATWNDEALLVMKRNNFTEETYFTWSYSPIMDEAGRINGVFCACAEETAKVIGKRRLKTLRDLGERTLLESKNAEDACRAAAHTLAGNPHDVPFALIYLLDEKGEQAKLCEVVVGPAGETDFAPARIQLNGESDVWDLNRVLADKQSLVVENLVARLGRLNANAWPDDFVRQAFVAPIVKAGAQELPAGFLVAGLSPRLPFDEEYRGFLELAAGHIGMVIANARAYEEERKRAEALAEIDRAKTAFFSNVSHEFRTPLTLMLGPLEDTLAEDDLPPNSREQLEVAHRNSLRLLKLVNTLLDFSRIEAGRLQAVYEPVDLASFTADLCSVFRSAIERAGMKLLVECRPLEKEVYVDREMWEKIVLNLLSNAFKFTFEGEIEVRLQPAGETVELNVRDTGTGIPAEEIPHLFERFHRVKSGRSRSIEGSGIGLALVQELVKLHGGNVHVKSEPDRGSVFTVTIPFGKSHLPADRIGAPRPLISTGLRSEAYVEEVLRWLPDDELKNGEESNSANLELQSLSRSPAPSLSHAPSRIVLADDNADMRDYVRRLLSGQYEVEAVADGEAALQAAREGRADLVLADVMMPRLDGFTLLRNLRADERTRLLPVILLSARAGEEARVEGLAAGADDYLTKPFSGRELLARVEAHLRIQRMRLEAAARERELRKEAEAARAQSQAVLESIRDAFSAFDPNWRYTYINDRGLQLSGLCREDFEGRTLWEVFPDLLGTEFETRLRQAMENREAATFESYYAPWDRWVENRVYPSADGVSLFTTDITERRRAEDTLQRAAALATFRVALEDALRPLADPIEVQATASRVLGERLRANRVVYFEVRGADYFVARDYVNGATPVRGCYPVASFGQRLLAAYRNGRTAFSFDVAADSTLSAVEHGAYAAIQIGAYIGVPLIKNGEFVAGLGVHSAGPRRWTSDEISLAEETAERTWAAVVRASAEEALRRSEEKYRTVFEAIDEGFSIVEMIFDDAGKPVDLRFLEVNPAHARLSGIENAAGRTAREIMPDLEDFWFEVYGKVALTGETVRFENKLEALNRWFDVYATRVGDAASRQVAAVFNNITERKRAEEALRSAIERERILREKAEEANRLKDEFLAVVTHELRTPLNSIHGWAGMLHGGKLSAEHAQKAIETIARNAKIQKQLIDDLLDVSRIVTGKMRLNIREVALDEIIHAAVETVRHAADAKGIDLRVEGEGGTRDSVILLSGDFDRLQQVVWNLVSNAIKFTPAKGRVVVTAQRTHSYAEIIVTDTGKGIKPEFLPYVFDRFRQEDASKSRKEGGLGLGLAIVRQLVELHGGEVRVQSPGEGAGATFIVSLPLPNAGRMLTQSPSAPQASIDSHLPGVLMRMRVLVVDDERDAQTLIRFILEREGAEVRTADSAAEGFVLINEWKPDLIVADIGMPDMDGYEFMRSLRTRGRDRGGLIPAVALTAYSRIEDRVQAMAAGYQMHVAKPVEPDEFLMVVAALMGRGSTDS